MFVSPFYAGRTGVRKREIREVLAASGGPDRRFTGGKAGRPVVNSAARETDLSREVMFGCRA